MTMGGADLDPLLHQPIRLRIMTVLFRNQRASAADLRQRLALTPGNLGSHIARLEQAGYVRSGRLLVDLSFEVHHAITNEGAAAFRTYLDDLARMLRHTKASAGLDAVDGTATPHDEPRRGSRSTRS